MRYWSLLFAAAAVFSIGLFVYAPFDPNWWLPGYQSTNTEVFSEVQRIDASVRSISARLEERTDLPKIVAELRRDQQRMANAAGRSLLLPHTRNAADQLATAASKLAEAQGAPPPAIATARRDALDALAAARGELDEALADTSRSVSSMGREIDHLFWIILIITGIVFIGTQIALVYVSWTCVDGPGRRATYFHGSQRLEVIWTIIPTAILVFIALYQMGTWANIKFRSALPKVQPLAEITARQFQWSMRYPGPDGRLNTADDLFTINDLHFVKNTPTVIYLRSSDVLHSFFLPQLRIKQDAVPGLTIPVWFDADKAGQYELVCAELCGWGHYKMRGKVTVHETQEEFETWRDNALREQNRDQVAAPVAVASEGR